MKSKLQKVWYSNVSGIEMVGIQIPTVLLNDQGSILSTKKFSEFWQNSQNSDNFLRFSKCVPIKIFWGKFSEICPASCTKIFCLKISQIFWKNWSVQNPQIFVRKFLRTRIFVDRTKPWSGCPIYVRLVTQSLGPLKLKLRFDGMKLRYQPVKQTKIN